MNGGGGMLRAYVVNPADDLPTVRRATYLSQGSDPTWLARLRFSALPSYRTALAISSKATREEQ
jgi:hypothetical protein